MITFEYNGKIYKPSNLENKLKKLGVTINDVKIIDDTQTKAEKIQEEKKQENIDKANNIKLYWDYKLKGWFLYNMYFPYINNMKKELDSDRYKYIGECNEDTVSELTKEYFPKIINGKL